VYQITAADAFLTFVEFTAIDVGTAGAKLAGGYDDDVINPVVAVHNWTRNGPISVSCWLCCVTNCLCKAVRCCPCMLVALQGLWMRLALLDA
jgi:hypothetical protein